MTLSIPTASSMALALALAGLATSSEASCQTPFRAADQAPADGAPRVYDLRAVLTAQETGKEPSEDRSARLDGRRTRVAQIAAACATFIDPPLKDEETIQGIGASHLACIGRAEQHEWLRRFLDLQVASHDTMLSLDSRIWQVGPELYATLGLDDGPRALDVDELRELTTRLHESECDILMAPRVLVFGLSNFSIETSNQVSFVRDYDLQSHGEGDSRVMIADPVVDVVRDGLSLEGVLARLDERRIGLRCDFRLAEIERPIPVREVVLYENSAPVKLQKPTVHRIEVDATATTTDGHAILFPAPEFRGNHPVVVLMPSLVEPEEETGKSKDR